MNLSVVLWDDDFRFYATRSGSVLGKCTGLPNFLHEDVDGVSASGNAVSIDLWS